MVSLEANHKEHGYLYDIRFLHFIIIISIKQNAVIEYISSENKITPFK